MANLKNYHHLWYSCRAIGYSTIGIHFNQNRHANIGHISKCVATNEPTVMSGINHNVSRHTIIIYHMRCFLPIQYSTVIHAKSIDIYSRKQCIWPSMPPNPVEINIFSGWHMAIQAIPRLNGETSLNQPCLIAGEYLPHPNHQQIYTHTYSTSNLYRIYLNHK